MPIYPPVYNTPQGQDLVKEILSQCNPPVYPHTYQIDGICASLDGESLLASMATGSGKTGFYSFLMLVVLAISQNPEKALGDVKFPKNPAMLVILPTKALQEDMRSGLSSLGLDAVVVNGDTVTQANQQGRNLWTECKNQHNMILISPEELLSSGF
ncbi:hypothetical protein BDQ17DRAFT_1437368 [Cyathus striatus]|nr:hypothetical protein BDQ17DRAFT_1437368 [Cyathus striatus]